MEIALLPEGRLTSRHHISSVLGQGSMASAGESIADDASVSNLYKSLWETYLKIEKAEESTSDDKIQVKRAK